MVIPSATVRDGLVSSRIDLFEDNPDDNKCDLIAAEQSSHQLSMQRAIHISVLETRDGTSTARSAETPRAGNKKTTLPTEPLLTSKVTYECVMESDYIGSRHIDAGVELSQSGQYDKALREFEMALSMQCALAGETYIGVALTLDNLGATYLQLGHYAQAEDCLTESLAMKEKLAPKLLISDTLNNLGSCACFRDKLVASLNYYQRALQDLRTKDGSAVDIANALFNISRLEIQQNNMDEAIIALNETWELTKQAHGQNHAFAAQTLDLMGFVQLSLHDYDAAMVSFTKALGIFRRLYGPIHSDVANSLFNVSMVRQARGELNDAWESYTTTRNLYSQLKTDIKNARYMDIMASIAKLEHAISRARKTKRSGNTDDRRLRLT